MDCGLVRGRSDQTKYADLLARDGYEVHAYHMAMFWGVASLRRERVSTSIENMRCLSFAHAHSHSLYIVR